MITNLRITIKNRFLILFTTILLVFGCAPTSAKIEGTGVIKEIKLSEHSLTLQHEPIPALNWPQMTMDFVVEDKIDLSKFGQNDNVKFKLKKYKNDEYIITDLEKIAP